MRSLGWGLGLSESSLCSSLFLGPRSRGREMSQSVPQGSGPARELRQSHPVPRRRKQCFTCWDSLITTLRGRTLCGEVPSGCILGTDRF